MTLNHPGGPWPDVPHVTEATPSPMSETQVDLSDIQNAVHHLNMPQNATWTQMTIDEAINHGWAATDMVTNAIPAGSFSPPKKRKKTFPKENGDIFRGYVELENWVLSLRKAGAGKDPTAHRYFDGIDTIMGKVRFAGPLSIERETELRGMYDAIKIVLRCAQKNEVAKAEKDRDIPVQEEIEIDI